MHRTACTTLLLLLLASFQGCEPKNTRGSGQVVMTPDGVVIDKYVIDGNTMQVDHEEFGGDGEGTSVQRVERYLSINHELDGDRSVRIRLRNRNGGLAVEVDETLDEMVVESVVSIAGPADQTKSDRLAKVELVVTEGPGGWLDVTSRWPGGEGRSGDQCVINVTVPRLDSIDLETINGSIITGACSGNVRARTMNGSISATDPNGDVDLQCNNGAIRLRLPITWSGTVKAHSNNGRINTQATGDAKIITNSYQGGHADLRVGTDGADPRSAKLGTENGSIDIQVG